MGIVAGPRVTNFLRPERWAAGDQQLRTATLDFTRLVLTIQFILTGVQLPARFLKHARRPVVAILSLGMLGMWVISSFLVWAICVVDNERMPFLHALTIGACIAPTDPVLAVTVIKGRWAENHVSPALAQLIQAESGANDGLGYPFLFFALYLIRYVGGNGEYTESGAGSAGTAMGMFFGETIGFVVLLSVAWGLVLGYAARRALRFANALRYVDKESCYAFSVILVLLFIGTCGMVGSDDILAAFIAGNVLTWDDWFRQKSEGDSFDPTIDMLLNWAIFIYFGAVCPWPRFAPSIHGEGDLGIGPLPLWRLICLAIAILGLRRLPVVLALWKARLLRGNVETLKQALFMGWFGPIGVSSIFYLHVTLEYLEEHVTTSAEGRLRGDVEVLYELVQVCVWFAMVSSVVSFTLRLLSLAPLRFSLSLSPRRNVNRHLADLPFQIVHGLSIFSWRINWWFAHHTKLGESVVNKHVFHIRDAWRNEVDYVKRVREISRLEEGERNRWLEDNREPMRPEPTFRRIKLGS